jgi:hypothetical protein
MRRSTIPHHLQTDAADLRRFRARATVINRRQRQKTAKLATVLAAAASMLALAGCQDTMLVAHARAWIFEHRYVGPGSRALRNLAVAARKHFDQTVPEAPDKARSGAQSISARRRNPDAYAAFGFCNVFCAVKICA